MSADDELTPEQRAKLAEQLDGWKPASAGLLMSFGKSVQDRRDHDHTTQREDWYCLNLAAYMGERVAAVLRRLLDTEAEVARLRDELAEEKADRNPRLRCLIVKAAPDRDLYVGWSGIAEGPTGAWTRAEALAYGFPRSRLDRADQSGSSALGDYRPGLWDDDGFIAEQRGVLPRARIGDYAQRYLAGDHSAAFDLLEPFEGETEVRR
ncbi:hypothetical protein [Streptomyces sp. 3214.6]|uniref:hypothetical protein n=1 Tax=Streptomyces sp. 3214.6 TaxID=1882757 RepID=UPI0009096332|nr:hypothetical protein [Streptomyces sp. 3214.6]SHI67083.1 hypothetical protein SAMN05444521_8193 [Streptomyces sp. 3214.6]